MAAHMCPSGTTIESRARMVEESEMHMEGQHAFEEGMRKSEDGDKEEFRRLESSEKTIAFLGDRWWLPNKKTQGDRMNKQLL